MNALSLDDLLHEEEIANAAGETGVCRQLHEDAQIVLFGQNETDSFFKENDEKPDFYLEEIDADEDTGANDPALADWYQAARLQRAFATPNLGVKYLHSVGDSESEDAIEKAIHAAIYRSDSQEANRHDRLLADVTRDGRRKGGTHALPFDKRRRRSAKIVNIQLIRWDATPAECREADVFYREVNARIERKVAYCLREYKGKYADVLSLLLSGLKTQEIAEKTGKTTRRIRQIVNGNWQRGVPGLMQFIRELSEPPTEFQIDPVIPVCLEQAQVKPKKGGSPKQVVTGQLAWDFDALATEVAA